MNTSARGLGIALGGALPVIAADQVIKGLVTTAFAAGGSHVLVPGVLYLTYTENKAAAFGILHNLPVPVFVVLIIAVLGVFAALVWPFLARPAGCVAAALVLGGAIGNLIDRVRWHAVIDYILLRVTPTYTWPIFNLADICVVVGIGLLVILLFRHEQQQAQTADVSTPASAAVDATPTEGEQS